MRTSSARITPGPVVTTMTASDLMAAITTEVGLLTKNQVYPPKYTVAKRGKRNWQSSEAKFRQHDLNTGQCGRQSYTYLVISVPVQRQDLVMSLPVRIQGQKAYSIVVKFATSINLLWCTTLPLQATRSNY